MTDKPADIKQQLEDLAKQVSSPGYRSTGGVSTKQKIMRALRDGQQYATNLYNDTTPRLKEYRDKFSKKGHNIIENMNKKIKKGV